MYHYPLCFRHDGTPETIVLSIEDMMARQEPSWSMWKTWWHARNHRGRCGRHDGTPGTIVVYVEDMMARQEPSWSMWKTWWHARNHRGLCGRHDDTPGTIVVYVEDMMTRQEPSSTRQETWFTDNKPMTPDLFVTWFKGYSAPLSYTVLAISSLYPSSYPHYDTGQSSLIPIPESVISLHCR